MGNHFAYFSDDHNRTIHVLVKDVIMRDEDSIQSMLVKEIDPLRERDFIEDEGYNNVSHPNIPFVLQTDILNAIEKSEFP